MSSSTTPRITPLTIEAQNYLYMDNTGNTDALTTVTTPDSLQCAVELSKYKTSTTASYNSVTQTCTINTFSPFPQYVRDSESTLLMKVASVVDTLVNNWTKQSSTTLMPNSYTDLYCSAELANVSYGRGLCANTAGCTGYRQYTDASTATDYGCLVYNTSVNTMAGSNDQAVFIGNRTRVVPLNFNFIDMNLAVLFDPFTLAALQFTTSLQDNINTNYSSKGDTSVINTFVLGQFTVPGTALCMTGITLNYSLPTLVDGYTVLITTNSDVITTTTVQATGASGTLNIGLFGKDNNGKASFPTNSALYVVLIVSKFSQLKSLPSGVAGGSIAAKYYLQPDADPPTSPGTPILSALPSGNIRRLTINSITLTISNDLINNTLTLPTNYVCCVGGYINTSTSSSASSFQIQQVNDNNNYQPIYSASIAGSTTFMNIPVNVLNSLLYASMSLVSTFTNNSSRSGTCSLVFFVNV